MSTVEDVAFALRPRAQVELGAMLAEAGDEDAEKRAWTHLVGLVERENRDRAVGHDTLLSAAEREAVAQELFNLFFRLGPVQRFLDDEAVEEIILNAPDRGFLLYAGGAKEAIDPRLGSEEEMRALLGRVVARSGRRLDESQPAVDLRLSDGARLHAVIPPIARRTVITIRRHRMVAEDMDDLVALGTLPREAAEFLRACVEGGINMLVSGGTASGKTTTLNALGRAIPELERVVTIEETAELRLEDLLTDCVALESRAPNIEGYGDVGIRKLVRHALRMRPTRIIVGEVRGPEALDMLLAMNTGHEGSMGTIHANSAREAISKLRGYVLMAKEALPAEVATEMIAETIDLVVHLRLDRSAVRGGTRRVVQIGEVAGLESGRVLTNDLFRLEAGGLVRTGIRPRFADRLAETASVIPLDRSARAEA